MIILLFFSSLKRFIVSCKQNVALHIWRNQPEEKKKKTAKEKKKSTSMITKINV